MKNDNQNAINDTFGYSRIIKNIFQVQVFEFACCMKLYSSLFLGGRLLEDITFVIWKTTDSQARFFDNENLFEEKNLQYIILTSLATT